MKLYRIQDKYLAFCHSRKTREKAPEGILLISSGGIGDTVLFSYVVEKFSALAIQNEKITLLCNQGSKKVSFLFPTNIMILNIDFQRLRCDLAYRKSIMNNLFEANFRLVIHTDHLRHPDMDEALARACQAEQAIAMMPRHWGKYSSKLRANLGIYDRLFDSGITKKDKIRRWLDFAAWLNHEEIVPETLKLPETRLPSPTQEPAPLVVIHPYSAVRQKQFPPSLYQSIIKCIPEHYNIVISGTISDRSHNSEFEILGELPNVRFEGTNFYNLARRLRAANLVVSVDTACMHLAVAVGAPTLCLASAAYVGEIVPYDSALTPPNVQFVYKNMDCEGCLGNCHFPPENGMYPCVAQLFETTVLSRVREML